MSLLDTHRSTLAETAVDRELVRRLAGHTAPVCVSIYLHTHRSGLEYRKDPIRLKNLLREANRRLAEFGVEKDAIEVLLEPARELLDDRSFWQHQENGLALLLDTASATVLRVPIRFEDLVVVDQRFHLKPLLPLITRRGVFHVLALSQRSPRLLEATPDSVREIDLGGEVGRLEDVVGYDWKERTLQFHGAGRPGSGGSVFHGHGEGRDDRQPEIERFFRCVDRAVIDAIGKLGPPLVLAGIDSATGTYRSISRYPNLLARSVSVDPGAVDDDELRNRAWPIVKPWFRAEYDAAVDRYAAAEQTPRGGCDLDEVLRAATDGRVDTLFVGVDRHAWGRYEPQTRTLTSAHGRRADHEDMLDRAAIESWVHGAVVYVVDPADVPGGGPVAAIYRY